MTKFGVHILDKAVAQPLLLFGVGCASMNILRRLLGGINRMRSFITRAAVDATCGVCICTCRDARPIRRRTDNELTPHRKVVPSPRISCILECLYVGLCFTLLLLSRFVASETPQHCPERSPVCPPECPSFGTEHANGQGQTSRGASFEN